MSADCLKLTTYFSERDRTAGTLVADALLDLYGRREVRVSALLRGAEGFGLAHHLRTDRQLTLSEDLPVVAVAVDTRERIEALLAEAAAVQPRGLLTLERAALLEGGEPPPAGLGAETKLTVFLGRGDQVGRRPAFVAVCDHLRRSGVAGATVLLGVDGTVGGRRARARFPGRNGDVPMLVVAVGPAQAIAEALSGLGDLLPHPIVTLERVRVCKRDGRVLSVPPDVPATDERGLARWQKLMVHTSESSLVDGVPAHLAIVRGLRESGARGVTCLRGMWGFHGEHAPHGDRLLRVRRRVPVVTIVVDEPERIRRSFGVIDELTPERGLVTAETVPVLAANGGGRATGGLRLAQAP